MVPDLAIAPLGLDAPPLSLPERVEVQSQWTLSKTSRLFRHRDWARTEIMGNYPVFWAIGAVMPKKILKAVLSSKADGANRLGANVKDADFDPAVLKKAERQDAAFAPEDQSSHIRKCIAAARAMGAKPILLCFPMHVEAYDVSPSARQALYEAVQQFERHIQQLAKEESTDVLLCLSEEFQEPSLWTRTPAHFNGRGARAIWEYLRAPWTDWQTKSP
jgi:hypothetical protein